MNPNRRLIVAWSLLQVTLAGTGCTSTPKVTRQTYTEKVATVMITQDKKQFVILGERYHYIFTAPQDLVALLSSPLKAKAAARFQPFLVTVDGVTTGDFHLSLPAGLSDDEAAQAKAMDFVQQGDGSWWHDGTLEGKRYIQGHTLRTGRIHANLSHTYEVSVEAEETAGEKAAQDLASPIASTADGMLMVYFAVLVPILIPLIFLTREKKPQASALAPAAAAASSPASAAASAAAAAR